MPRKVRTLKTSLNGGQVDALMLGRSDTVGYLNGLAEAQNYMPYVHGGITTRMGSQYLDTLTGKSRVLDFEFSSDQRYVFAFRNNAVEIFDDAGTSLADLTGAPWTTAQLFPDLELEFTQYGDVMFVTHEDFATRVITRTGASTFTLSTYAFENNTTAQAWLKYATDASTLTLSATSGSVTVTCSEAVFVDNHIGTELRVLDGSTVRYLAITAVGSTTPIATCTATCGSTFSGTGPFEEWKEYAFSAARAWPRAVTIHSNRLWFAGGERNHVFGSKVGRYYSMSTDDGTDDDSVDKEIPSEKIHEVRHLVSSDFLQIFTDKGVFYVPETDDSPITPANFKIKPQQPYGANYATPVVFDDATLFAQSQGRAVREFLYDDIYRKHSADAISLLSTDVIETITELSVIYGVANRPEHYCAAVNSDGTVALFHGIRAQKIAAWYPWTTDGSFVSMCSVGDYFYACCERTINAGTVYTLEKFDASYQCDCATKDTDVTPKAIWTGLTEYANTEVDVYSGNLHVGRFTVDGSGELDLGTTDVTAIEVGFSFETLFLDLPPDSALPEGTIIGEKIRVSRITMRVHDTFGMTIGSEELIIRNVDDDLSLEPDPKTGIVTFPVLGWTRTGQTRISRAVPVKHTILSYTKDILV